MSAHTPGPWMVLEPPSRAEEVRLRVVSKDQDIDIAELNCDADATSQIEATRADADLIAAAPELLAALKRLMDGAGEDNHVAALEQARAAIAKAEGRS